MNPLRQQTYRPGLVALARGLQISGSLKKWYYRWTVPPEGIFRLKLEGLDTCFYARTPGELRLLEVCFCEEERILRLLISRVQAGNVVYDIGSNVGQYTIPLAKAVGKCGQVISFEPELENFERLQENVRLNSLGNVRVFRKALGDRSGEGILYSHGSVSNLRQQHVDDSSQHVVEVVTGDAFQQTENSPQPQVIKIDVEGYEYAVLQGLRNTLAHPGCELVICEIHPMFLPAEVRPEAILSFLQSLGFTRIDTYTSPRKQCFHVVACKGSRGTKLKGVEETTERQ